MTEPGGFRAMDQAELRALEAQCIQDCPPPCTAACPLHVDVRGVLGAFADGEDDAAFALLRRALPFPGIVGRICEQPCRPVCNRALTGDAIRIAALERACREAAIGRDARQRPLPRRTQSVAVIGAGLAGLTAAFDLAAKGYRITVCDARPAAGGRIRDLDESVLPTSIIEDDLRFLAGPQITLQLGSTVTEATFGAIIATNDAALIATGTTEGWGFALEAGADGSVAVDPLTYATSRHGVFAAGSLLRARGGYASIVSMSDGRRAATSIDRFLQGVSLTASRTGEGAVESCLVTNLAGVEPLPAVPASGPGVAYTLGEARREAARCLRCECMECVKVCEYLRHYDRYPRRAVREIYNNLSIVKGTRYANRMINACSLCGLCTEVCPTGFDMPAVIAQSRETMVRQERMPPSAHDFALRDLAFSRSEAFALVRNAPGTTASDAVLFPGCQLAGSSPEHVEQVYRYLADALPTGTRLGLILGCCGAPAEWAGRGDLLEETLDELRAALAVAGNPRVILPCSSCLRTFRSRLPDVVVESLWEVMAAAGLPADAVMAPGTSVSIHDACATRHDDGLQDDVRSILGSLGYVVDELPRTRERTTCCGYGGMQWLADAETAGEVVAARVAEGERDYVAYCAMCRDFLAKGGKPTAHLLDLVFGGSMEQAGRPMTGWSARHEHRARLKRRMLEAIWGETVDDDAKPTPLHIAEDVLATMEARLILVADVRHVVDEAERTGRWMVLASGNRLASGRPAAVTYWVEYTADADGITVHNAYSHRMEVIER